MQVRDKGSPKKLNRQHEKAADSLEYVNDLQLFIEIKLSNYYCPINIFGSQKLGLIPFDGVSPFGLFCVHPKKAVSDSNICQLRNTL